MTRPGVASCQSVERNTEADRLTRGSPLRALRIYVDTTLELAAVPVLFRILCILVVEELDEGERLLSPATAHVS